MPSGIWRFRRFWSSWCFAAGNSCFNGVSGCVIHNDDDDDDDDDDGDDDDEQDDEEEKEETKEEEEEEEDDDDDDDDGDENHDDDDDDNDDNDDHQNPLITLSNDTFFARFVSLRKTQKKLRKPKKN